jgi:site-specific recombinase XerD
MALDAFLISREAMRVNSTTLDWYRSRLGRFLDFLAQQRVTRPEDITPHHVRLFLVSLERRQLSDWYIHGHARAIKTFLRFLHAEGIIPTNPMERVKMR